jgi:NADPH-dependent ferric siderophore reductase
MTTTDIAATGSTIPDTALRVERVRHVFAAHHLQLQSREVVSPGFVRITLAGADLTGFRSDGFDDHIKFLLPQPGQDKPSLPQMVDGRPTLTASALSRGTTPGALGCRQRPAGAGVCPA